VQVGFVGLGKMGQPMTQRLLAAGHTVHVFNRSRGAIDALAAEGARPADSAAQVAERADVVMAALPTPESVQSVFAEMAGHARSGQTFIDHSTVSPGLNRACAEELKVKGANFLDAPVSGGPAGAQAGTLTVMVGGEQAVFDAARPVLQAFGKNIRLCGPIGAGQVV
jgi:3-hydroxyisobutyrate dehydrogenase-like beta-hydroxyacid dehydrogenase